MIPGSSIFFMAVSAALSFGLPVVLFIVWRKKYNMKLLPVFIGVTAFILFAMILEQIMHVFVLQPKPDGSIDLARNNPVLFIIYGIFAAGVFEETARFIAFRLLKKKYDGIGTGLSYGIGHGGIEAILITGLTMISVIAMSLTINNGNMGLLGDDPVMLTQISILENTNSVLFLVSGLERVVAIAAHISLSMLVWCAVKVKGKLWLYPAAIVLHATVNIAPSMYQAGILSDIWIVEFLTLLPTVIIALIARHFCKVIKQEEEKEAEAAMETNAEADYIIEEDTEIDDEYDFETEEEYEEEEYEEDEDTEETEDNTDY